MLKEIFELFKSDSLHNQALEECYEMLDIVKEMFNESTKTLRKSDTAEIPIDIYAMDKKINEFEIPTGNPLLLQFNDEIEVKNFKYLDEKRSKKILFNV